MLTGCLAEMSRSIRHFAVCRTVRVALALAAAALNGCSTITVSEAQSVMVTTHAGSGAIVEQAECSLTNDKGAWSVKTPGAVKVTRSAEDLQLECSRDGHPKGLAKAISRAHGGMFGNIIFGGGIGAIIDHSQGTGYDYPDAIDVVMGKSIVVDRRDQQAAEPAGAAPAR